MTDPRQEARFAELMRVGARAPAYEPPSDLEAKLLAFVDGAAARASRGPARTWLVWLTLVPASATAAWLVVATIGNPDARTQVDRSVAGAPGTASQPVALAGAERPPAPAHAARAPEPPLVQALRSAQDWRSRRSAALTLQATPTDAAGEAALAAALEGDPNWRVREAALVALRKRQTDRATRALARASEDPHLPLRLAAVRALERRAATGADAPAAREALLRRLDRDPDWRVREAALDLLLRSPEGARAAQLALVDRHRKLRALARAALASAAATADSARP